MKIIKAGYEILSPINRVEILKSLEIAGRVCYKSEEKTTDTSASEFVKMLIKRGHEAMIEHYSMSVKFVCDRGVSHEIVRHRIASFGQESTRYCNYSKEKFGNEITVIKPCFIGEPEDNCTWDECLEMNWEQACKQAEHSYFLLLKNGATPQEARSVLPNSLKTEIVVTMNMCEWRHFFRLRTASVAHPQMREITIPLLNELKIKLPELFDDIEVNQGRNKKMSDAVNHPSHYNSEKRECIEEMRLMFGNSAVSDFCRCNIFKYRQRASLKNGKEDLDKAEWYMDYLEKLER